MNSQTGLSAIGQRDGVAQASLPKQGNIIQAMERMEELLVVLDKALVYHEERAGWILKPPEPSKDCANTASPVKSELAEKIDSYCSRFQVSIERLESITRRIDL